MSATDRRRRVMTGAAVVACASLLLAGCGSEEADREAAGGGGGSSSASPSESAGATGGPDSAATVDVADPGEDLLDGITTGVVMKGTDVSVTWRFPETYRASVAQQASLEDGGKKYDLSVGFKAGTDAETEGRALQDRARADQEVTVGQVDVAGKDIVTTATDSTSGSLRTYFWSPEGVDGTYAVLFYAYGTTVADTPGARLDEVYQTVGSLELEPAP